MPSKMSDNMSDDSAGEYPSPSPKKRRISPPPLSDQAEERVEAFTNVPSRIKRKTSIARFAPGPAETSAAEPESGLEPGSVPGPAKRILAPTDPNTTFESLGVKPWLVQSLTNMAIARPTGIQKGCIPQILKGRDCIGWSRTGSGKTVAFAAPILQHLAESPSAIFAVVLTPTRELALQMLEQFKAISGPQTLRAVLLTGGADMMVQAIALTKRPHIVIATPGRFADHIRSSREETTASLKKLRYLVLDEADRLLAAAGPGSMLPDVEECLDAMPDKTQRQTLVFTATISPEVRALENMARGPGQQPVFFCEVDTQVVAVPESLNQMYLQVPGSRREYYLHIFLTTEANADKSIIVFCNRNSTAEYLYHLLHLLEHRVTGLYSKLPQRQRTDNLGRFRATAARILVATDLAARGLDIPEVGLVINYDVPRDPDDYIHRVGRTARASRRGDAVTFVGERDVELVHAIEQRAGRPLVAWEEEGVNIEKRVTRDALKLVDGKKIEAQLEMEENREVGGKRKREKKKLRAQ